MSANFVPGIPQVPGPRLVPRRPRYGNDELSRVDALLSKQKEPVQTVLGQDDNTDDAMHDAAKTSANVSAGYFEARRDLPIPSSPLPGLGGVAVDPSQDSTWTDRHVSDMVTRMTGMFGDADVGTNPDQAPTGAAVAKDIPKMYIDGDEGKARQALIDANHRRGPDFSDRNAARERVKDAARRVREEASSKNILRYIPFARHFAPDSTSELHAALVEQKIAEDAAIEQHREAHPELYQPAHKLFGVAPGHTAIDETTLRPVFTAPDKPGAQTAADRGLAIKEGEDNTLSVVNPHTAEARQVTTPNPDFNSPFPDDPLQRRIPFKTPKKDTLEEKTAAKVKVKETTPGKAPAAPKTEKQSPEDRAKAGLVKAAHLKLLDWQAKNPGAKPAKLKQFKDSIDPDGTLLGSDAKIIKYKSSAGHNVDYNPNG